MDSSRMGSNPFSTSSISACTLWRNRPPPVSVEPSQFLWLRGCRYPRSKLIAHSQFLWKPSNFYGKDLKFLETWRLLRPDMPTKCCNIWLCKNCFISADGVVDRLNMFAKRWVTGCASFALRIGLRVAVPQTIRNFMNDAAFQNTLH